MSVHILFTDANIFFWHKPLEVRFTLSKREKRENGFKTKRSSQIQHEPRMVFITKSMVHKPKHEENKVLYQGKTLCEISTTYSIITMS